jgi:hypothetical protein
MIFNKESRLYSGSCWPGIILSMIIYFPCSLNAQYSSNSLYSFYGIGDIKSSGAIKTSAMGGSSIALKSENFINNLNPASLSEFDSTTFIFSAGINGYLSAFKSGNASESAADFNFNHFAFGFPITKWWGAAAGLVPFSSVGYDISISLPVEGTTTNIEKQFKGTGGVNRFYLMNTFRLFKQLSVGINVSYLMGTVTQTELNKLKPFDYPDISTTRTRYFRNFYYELGLQFIQEIGDDRLSLGITCNPVQKLKSRYSVEILIPDVDTLTNEPDNQPDFIMPLALGAGLAYNINSSLEFVFDYGFQNWSGIELPVKGASLTDSYHYNFGMEYFPVQKLSRNYLRVIRYRLGAYYENTYIEMRGNSIRDRGITFGAGLPIGRQKSSVDIALGIGQLGSLNSGLVQKTYGSIKIGFNLHDYWFIKRRFD